MRKFLGHISGSEAHPPPNTSDQFGRSAKWSGKDGWQACKASGQNKVWKGIYYWPYICG